MADYFGCQEVHYGDFYDWHRPEQDDLSRDWTQRPGRNCAAEEVLSQATTSVHFKSTADADRDGGLRRSTLSGPSSSNSGARCQTYAGPIREGVSQIEQER